MEKILSDTNKFLKVTFNPKQKVNKEIRHLLDIGSSIKNCLDDLFNNNYLSKEDYKFLKPVGSKPGIMYGLCKFHKCNSSTNDIPPFRPVLSAIGTATYNLAKFFVPILQDFTVNEYTVNDSFSFCKEIKNQDSSLFMTSFDIQSLFTDIPLDETINICVDRAFQNKRKVKGLLKRHFKQLLTLAVKSSCFVFNDIYYKQIDGVAMGSPLGLTFANLFFVYYEHKWLENCPLPFKPTFYRRYVDDMFLRFDKKDHVKKFLKYLNNRHRNIKFTFEEEQDNKTSLIDISITRVGNELQTSLFRKKTFSGVYLNFNSHLPNMYKKGLIDTLLYRAYNICSNYSSFHQEINYLKTVWQKNLFPLFFIDKCVQKFLNKLFIKRNHQNLTSTKKEVLITYYSI